MLKIIRTYLFPVLLSSLLLSVPDCLKAQEGVQASVDTTHLIIGQQTHFTLTFRYPAGARPGWPQWGDTLTGAIEIVNRSKIDTLPVEKGLAGLRQVLTLSVYDSGVYFVPPVQVGYMREADTAPKLFVSNPIPLKVSPVEVDTTKAFRDIKIPVSAPVTLREVIPWIFGALVGVAIIIFIVWTVRQRMRKESIIPERRKIVLSPHVEAIQRLEELRLRKLWQNGQVKFYYTELTDIIRHYLERRFDIQAAEMTSDEILEAVNRLRLNRGTLSLLEGMLRLADLVKFAKMEPLPLENDTALNHALDFVKETIPGTEEPGVVTPEAAVPAEEPLKDLPNS